MIKMWFLVIVFNQSTATPSFLTYPDLAQCTVAKASFQKLLGRRAVVDCIKGPDRSQPAETHAHDGLPPHKH